MKFVISAILFVLCLSVLNAIEPETQSSGIEMKTLSSKNLLEANTSAIRIFKMGKMAIPILLENANSTLEFSGDFYVNPARSARTEEEIFRSFTVGQVCVYLIEAILRGDLFFADYPLIVEKKKTNLDKDAIHRKAVSCYSQWWQTNKDKPFALGKDVLEEENLNWPYSKK